MKPSAFYDRVVDVMEELVKFTLLLRDRAPYLVDRYSERKESAEELIEAGQHRSDLAEEVAATPPARAFLTWTFRPPWRASR